MRKETYKDLHKSSFVPMVLNIESKVCGREKKGKKKNTNTETKLEVLFPVVRVSCHQHSRGFIQDTFCPRRSSP